MITEQPSIYPFGLRVDEPITCLTDWLITGVCMYAFWQLRRPRYAHRAILQQLLTCHFLFMAAATFLSGLLGHAFLYILGETWRLLGWGCSLIGVGLLAQSALLYTTPPFSRRTYQWLSALNLVAFILAAAALVMTRNFLIVVIYTGLGLLGGVTSLHAWAFLRTRHPGSGWMLIGVMVTAIAAVAFLRHWYISPWFTHDDLSHCLIAISTFCMYLGSRLILLCDEYRTV